MLEFVRDYNASSVYACHVKKIKRCHGLLLIVETTIKEIGTILSFGSRGSTNLTSRLRIHLGLVYSTCFCMPPKVGLGG
jgi:hypothetical protein